MKGIALILALYMFVGSFFPRTDFGQLAKMGNLMEHYRQHQFDNQTGAVPLSFTAFLKVHFLLLDEHQEAPGHDHEELPFHTINHSQNYTVQAQSGWYSSILPDYIDQQFYYSLSIQEVFVNSIFHPPVLG